MRRTPRTADLASDVQEIQSGLICSDSRLMEDHSSMAIPPSVIGVYRWVAPGEDPAAAPASRDISTTGIARGVAR